MLRPEVWRSATLTLVLESLLGWPEQKRYPLALAVCLFSRTEEQLRGILGCWSPAGQIMSSFTKIERAFKPSMVNEIESISEVRLTQILGWKPRIGSRHAMFREET